MNGKKLGTVAGGGAALALIYWPAFRWMWEQWNGAESYYSHGPLILCASGWFIWMNRRKLAGSSEELPAVSAYVLLVSAALLHALGMIFSFYFLSAFSLPLLLLGLSRFFLGRRRTAVLLFPVLYLYFMVPLPMVLISNISFRMKMIAAEAAAAVLHGMGMGAVLQGSTILLPHASLEVAAPCSGLRSLISLAAFGAAFAYIADVSIPKKLILLISVVPVALSANICRIVLLGAVAEIYGIDAIHGWVHEASGFLLFAVALAGMAVVYSVLSPADNGTDAAMGG